MTRRVMTMRKRIALGATGLVLVAVGIGGGVAAAGSGDGESGSDSVTRHQAAAATDAALRATGGGTANSVERDSENGATWEVEVHRTDGSTVDVRLDASYRVVVIEGDQDSSSDG
jgi:hypothetical protein